MADVRISGTHLTTPPGAPPETAAGADGQVERDRLETANFLNRHSEIERRELCDPSGKPTGGSERPPEWMFQRLIALIVYRMVPAGALTVTVSPRRLPRSARPTGDSLLIRSRRGSASGDPTMV